MQSLLHIIHILVGLLYYSQCYSPLSGRQRGACRLLRNDGNLRQVLQLEYPSPLSQVYIPNIFLRTKQCRKFNIIFVITITHRHTTRFDIVGRQRHLYIFLSYTRHLHHCTVRNNLQLTPHLPRHIHHRHFRKLFDTTLNYGFGKLTQIKKCLLILLTTFIRTKRQIQTKHRYIRSTCFYHPRTFRIARKIIHRRVNLFIHFNKRQFRIRSKVEAQTNNPRTVACFTLDVTQSG